MAEDEDIKKEVPAKKRGRKAKEISVTDLIEKLETFPKEEVVKTLEDLVRAEKEAEKAKEAEYEILCAKASALTQYIIDRLDEHYVKWDHRDVSNITQSILESTISGINHREKVVINRHLLYNESNLQQAEQESQLVFVFDPNIINTL